MASDPYYYLNNFYLPMDGANNGTTFTNVAPNGTGLVTATGNVKTVTAAFKFGTASAYFDGVGDYLVRNGNHSSLSMGTGDFTVDFFAAIEANQGASDTLFTLSDGGAGIRIRLNGSGSPPSLLFETNAGTAQIVSLSTVSLTAFHHYRVTRSAGVFYFFIDGVLQGSDASQTGYTIDSQNFCAGSGYAGAAPFKGWIDELRILKGYCASTATFAVPTEALNDRLNVETFGVAGALATPPLGTHAAVDAAALVATAALPVFAPESLVDTVATLSPSTGLPVGEPLANAVVLADASSGVQTIVGAALTGAVAVRDTLDALILAMLADSATTTDAVSAAVGAAALIDAATIADSASGVLAVQATLADTATLADALGYGWLASPLTDGVVFASASSGGLALAAVGLADVAILTDALSGVMAYSMTLVDVVSASDALAAPTFALIAIPLLNTVRAVDALVVTGQQVTVINAATGAVSAYDLPVEVRGLGQLRGTLYLACADGLYALDAAEDETGAVVWTLATGFSNLGDDRIKRIRDVNVQGRTEGDLTLTATTGRAGTKRDDTFRLPARLRVAYRDGVVKIGRGLQSVYWGLTLRGEGPAELNELRLAVEPLSRRR